MWLEKTEVSALDANPPVGLFYLDGDAMGRRTGKDWAEGYKYAMIAFPSGAEFSIWAGQNPTVHFFGELDLPLHTTRAEAYAQAVDISEQCGYLATPASEDQLEVWGRDAGEHFLITINDQQGMIVDVARLP